MSCDSNDDVKLTKEYKYLLSCIRPLIDQLDKSRDAQLCLLWLSKLEQCRRCERSYRNKILSELCKQVKSNCLKEPFNAPPPNGSLQNVICGELRSPSWNTDGCSEGDPSTEEIISSSSQNSCSSIKNPGRCKLFSPPWKEGHFCSPSKNKESAKLTKEPMDHSEFYAIHKAYHERAQSDQAVIEKYQDIIKSLASQQLKAEISPGRLKKIQATYENKLEELLNSLKKTEEKNALLKRKIEVITYESEKLEGIKNQNENLKKQITDLEGKNKTLEAKLKQVEEEKITMLKDVIGKLNETELKLKESEKRFLSLQRKQENFCNRENQGDNEKNGKCVAEISTLEKLLAERQAEIISLKKQMSNQNTQFEQEVSRLKQELHENSNVHKNKKIKILKNKTRKLEKIRKHMTVVFQSQLQQILAKKDFYIATLEMQLKINRSDFPGDNLEPELHDSLNKKVSYLEMQYRKLLEESEQRSLKQRQLDLQKIHTLESQLLLCGGVIEDTECNLKALKTISLTSVTESKDKTNIG